MLVAPSEISFLAESTIQTTFQTIVGIQQQINLSLRQRLSGWNAWMNGQVSELQIGNSSSGFPSDPGVPLSGTVGFDYHWQSGWLAGAAVTVGNVTPTFSLGGNFTQNEGTLSLYAAYLNNNWWGNLIAGIGVGDFNMNRQVPIGITVQPNNGSTVGTDLSLAGELGYEFHTGFLTHGPVAGFILQRVDINGFTESGSFTSLSFGRQIRNSEVGALGYQAGFRLRHLASIRPGRVGPRVRPAQSSSDCIAYYNPRRTGFFDAGHRGRPRLGDRDCGNRIQNRSGLDRACLLHGSAGPAECYQFWRPAGRKLYVWSATALADYLQELIWTKQISSPKQNTN